MPEEKTWKDEDVFEFVRDKWENTPSTKRDWDQVARDLAKAGHRSARKGGPLTGNACRTIYYNFKKGLYGKSRPSITKYKGLVDNIKAALMLKADDRTVRQLITQMIEQAETSRD